MPNTLFIRPCQVYQTQDAMYEWALYDIAGVQLKYGKQASLDLIDQTLMQNGIDNLETIGFWPANAVLSSKVTLPGKQSRFIQQALPFAVEEQIAQDIEQVHLALGKKSKTSEHSVLSVDKALFRSFFEALVSEDVDFPLKAIHLDAETLPLASQALTLCVSEKTILVKGKDERSISLLHANLIPYLDSLFLEPADESEEEGASSLSGEDVFGVKIYIELEQVEQAAMLIAQIEQYPGVVVETEQISMSQFELLCESYFRQNQAPINLCQSDFQVSSQSNGTWQKWRAVALIAGLGFLLQLGVFIGQGTYLEKQADTIGQQALATYKKIVPNSSRVTVAKLARIIKGKLNQKDTASNSDIGFLSLLGEAGYQFKNSKYNAQLSFNSINYNEQRGELIMEMQAQSFEQLESLKKAIDGAGLKAKISSAVQEKDYFRGRISVSGA